MACCARKERAIVRLVQRRYALLDDNQRVLEARLIELARRLPGLVGSRVCAAGVIGSVAEGCARDQSDLDLVLVLREGEPRRSDYEWWEAEVAPALGTQTRFPAAPVFIARTRLATVEPNLRHALDRGIPLWDPEGRFRDESKARP